MEYYTAVKNDKLLIYVTIRMNLATGALSAGGCDWRTKHGGKEIPHVRGQGQKPGGPHARRAAAKRSYPTFEVRGSSRVPGCDGAGTAERSYPASEVRGDDERSYPASEARGGGLEEQLHSRGQGPRPGGPTACTRSPGCAGIGGPGGAIPQKAVVRRYPSSKVRSSGCALVQQP